MPDLVDAVVHTTRGFPPAAACTTPGTLRKMLGSPFFNAAALVFVAAHALHMYLALAIAPPMRNSCVICFMLLRSVSTFLVLLLLRSILLLRVRVFFLEVLPGGGFES